MTAPSPDARSSVRARAAIRTESGPGGGTRLDTLRSDPPLTLRQTGPDVVHLVSTAAGPLGGDHLALDIDVAPGTTLDVRSIASTLVLPGPFAGDSVMVVNARVGAGASLRFAPEPTVLAAGSSHRVAVRLSLSRDAAVFWREEIVFGRYGEQPGRCRSRFDAVVDGSPLLRQELVVGDPATDGSPAVYGTARCVGSTLITGYGATGSGGDAAARREPSEHAARRAMLGDGCAVLPLAGPGVLVSALADDAVQLRVRLEWGEALAVPFCRESPTAPS
ncbi:urease accessory protein UreD [Microtetraspora sp. NBRC 16547]|uniref:urease accessory protein UreD n=1 Tax=Microtetraspora sp. NBRC 16547 TaxID=3030993 RepID=UPI00249FA29C|nr:urease accessory protein UreD [Microtetraspora sp. NBRC 16547]GLW97895.1 urease accessory protein UreD [Microtetraspora sp. NBRC 16547]